MAIRDLLSQKAYDGILEGFEKIVLSQVMVRQLKGVEWGGTQDDVYLYLGYNIDIKQM